MSLNERQKAFCEYYAACFNAAEAARKAGYSQKTARSIGQRLLTHVDIQKYLESLKNQAKSSRIATIDEVLCYLTETMRNDNEATRERTKAAQLLKEAISETKDSDSDSVGFVISVEDFS